MLSSSCYEETLLQATSRLLSTDLHHRLKKQLAASNQGISPHNLLCAVCRNFLRVLKDDDYDIVFRYYFNFCHKISTLPLCIPRKDSCCLDGKLHLNSSLFSDVDVIIFLFGCANRSFVAPTLWVHHIMMCHM